MCHVSMCKSIAPEYFRTLVEMMSRRAEPIIVRKGRGVLGGRVLASREVDILTKRS